ncbi:MAG: hypothetical protein JJT88_05780 [Gammaproteobacteria bacterium]|nr:hypothetical protein [Gammaproteobacteria bacterium]
MTQDTRGDPRRSDGPASAAQRAHELSWPHWQLEEERPRTRLLLALLLPSSALYFLLDLRFEGPQFWLNLSLRALFMGLLVAALIELTRGKHPQRVYRIFSAGMLSLALFYAVRYGQGLGLAEMPGHLPSDLIVILIIFLIPAAIVVQALAAGVIAAASVLDYTYWKEVGGAASAMLIATLVMTWCLGLAISLGRQNGLRQRYDALREVHLLRSSIPICAWCKSIRDDAGIWGRLETYLEKNADMMLTHGVCPSCMEKVEAEDPHHVSET